MKGSVKTKLDEMAYQRDGYKCVECGKTSGIEAHHIIPDVEKIENLITLCHSCHKKRHNMSGCFKKGCDSKRNVEAGKRNLVLANLNRQIKAGTKTVAGGEIWSPYGG